MNGIKNSVTWTQILTGWPLLVAVVALVLSYAALITRITVMETKLDNAIALMESYQKSQSNVITNLNDLNKRLVVVETEHQMNRR